MNDAPAFVAEAPARAAPRLEPPAATRARIGLVCWLAALFSGTVPWLVCVPAPLLDWPNHIARVFIELRLIDGDPFWSQFYRLNTQLVPNMALDVVIGGLTWLGLDIDLAANLFLIMTFLVFVAGFARLARASGASDVATPLIATIIFLSGPLMFGLANYFFAVGAGFWAAGAWLDGDPRRRWTLALLATPAIYTMHLIGAAVFVLIIGAYDLVQWVRAARTRRLDLRADASSLAAFLVLLALVLVSPTAADSMPQADGSNVWYPGHGHLIPTLIWKGRLIVNFFIHHATIFAAAATWLGVAVYLALVGLRARGRASAGAVLALGTVIVFFAISPEAMGNGSLLDYRLWVLVLALAAATIGLEWRGRRARALAVGVTFAVCLLRGTSFAIDFRDQREEMTSFEAALAKLPTHGIILSARGRYVLEIPLRAGWTPPITHMNTRAVFDGDFVPSVFANESQQPMVLKPDKATWRRNWYIHTDADLAAFLADTRALCQPGGWDGPVLLYISYPGPAKIPPDAIVARGKEYILADVCRIDGG